MLTVTPTRNVYSVHAFVVDTEIPFRNKNILCLKEVLLFFGLQNWIHAFGITILFLISFRNDYLADTIGFLLCLGPQGSCIL